MMAVTDCLEPMTRILTGSVQRTSAARQHLVPEAHCSQRQEELPQTSRIQNGSTAGKDADNSKGYSYPTQGFNRRG